MTTIWTEANFLERLKVPLKNAHEASASSCPDAEMMTAYVENSASEFVRNAVDEHLKSCADCRELAERLAGFDAASAENVTAMSAAQQAEWANAGKRLDIEADNFVRTAEVDFKKAARVATAAKEEGAAEWQFPWGKTAWSVAAVAALVVAGFFLMRGDGGTETQINSAQNAPSAAVTAPAAQSVPENPAPTTEPPIAVANESGTNTIVIPPNATTGAATETPKTTSHGVNGTTTKRATVKHSEPEVSAPTVAANSATDTSSEQPACVRREWRKQRYKFGCRFKRARVRAELGECGRVECDASGDCDHYRERGVFDCTAVACGGRGARDWADAGGDSAERRNASLDRVQDGEPHERYELRVYGELARADSGSGHDSAAEGHGNRWDGSVGEWQDVVKCVGDCAGWGTLPAEGNQRSGDGVGERFGGGV